MSIEQTSDELPGPDRNARLKSPPFRWTRLPALFLYAVATLIWLYLFCSLCIEAPFGVIHPLSLCGILAGLYCLFPGHLNMFLTYVLLTVFIILGALLVMSWSFWHSWDMKEVQSPVVRSVRL